MVFVPWALRWAAALEGQRVRETSMVIIATPTAFPAWGLVAGMLIDLAWLATRSGRVSVRPGPALLAGGAAAGLTLGLLDRPWERTLLTVRGGQSLDVGMALVTSLPAVVVVGALGAVYGIGLGGALRSRPDSRRAMPVLYAILVALGAAGAWTLVLALAGAMVPGPVPVARWLGGAGTMATPVWLGWGIGLIPVWGLLGLVASQTPAARDALARLAHRTGTQIAASHSVEPEATPKHQRSPRHPRPRPRLAQALARVKASLASTVPERRP